MKGVWEEVKSVSSWEKNLSRRGGRQVARVIQGEGKGGRETVGAVSKARVEPFEELQNVVKKV